MARQLTSAELALREVTALRGQLGVAVALLRECIGPLEVSAAVIESDDTEQMETLIRRVQAFVAAASGMQERPAGASTEACGLCQGTGWLFTGEATDGLNGLLEGRNSQHVLKAEGESPDATDRENCAKASPDGGPMGAGQAAAAAPAGVHSTRGGER